MKKTAIIGLSLLLSACASDTYNTNVTSESYQEDYQKDVVSKPIMSSENAVVEKDVEPTPVVKPTIVKKSVKPEEKKVVKLVPQEQVKLIKVVSHSNKPLDAQRFGYTIQVAAFSNKANIGKLAKRLPQNDEPIWENYKVINDTKWYSVLYGDYSTSKEAQKAIATLPTQFQQLKPFVKSISSIKNSEYPTLNKLN